MLVKKILRDPFSVTCDVVLVVLDVIGTYHNSVLLQFVTSFINEAFRQAALHHWAVDNCVSYQGFQ